jgi:hypothetical protein
MTAMMVVPIMLAALSGLVPTATPTAPRLGGRPFAVPEGCEIVALSGGASVQCTSGIFRWVRVPDGTDDFTEVLVKPFRGQGLAENPADCAVEGVPARCRALRTMDRKPPAVYAAQADVRGERVAVLCVDRWAGHKLPPVCASALSVAGADIMVAEGPPWSIKRIACWAGLAAGALMSLSWWVTARRSE